MDILKSATDWARAEVFSSSIFIFSGVAFLLASYAFWQLGKTELSKAYVIPSLVAGLLLLAIGLGIFLQSYGRITSFATDFDANPAAFIEAERVRAAKVLNDYQIALFRVFPVIIAVCAVLIMFLDSPIWRASLVTTIVALGITLVIDTNASARLKIYQEQLALIAK